MANYTFEQLMKMDIFARAEAVENMTENERTQVALPPHNVVADKQLREAIARTPTGKHLAEL